MNAIKTLPTNTTELMSKEEQAIFEKGLDMAYIILFKTKTSCKA